MRVTFVVHQFPPRYFTGTEQYAFAVGTALRQRGHDVDVFTLDPAFAEITGPFRSVTERVGDLPVTRVNYWNRLDRDWRRLEYRHAYMAEVFARHVRTRDSDIVHSFHLRHVGADLLGATKALGKGLVVHLTDFWFLCPQVTLVRSDGQLCDGPPDGGAGCVPCIAPDLAEEWSESPVAAEIRALHATAPGQSRPGWDLRSRVATLLERPAFLRDRLLTADAIVASTSFLRDRFVDNGVPRDRITCLGYGIDVASIAPEAQAGHGGARPLTFAFHGTLARHKGAHVLVDAMRAMRGDCRVILRGRAADFPEYSKPLLEQAARDPRITCAGPFAKADLPTVLAAIDVLVVPSLWHENAPFVVLEARAAGLPVLASRQGGLAEIVRDEVDGELFTPGDAGDLARRMQRLVDEPDRLQRYRAAVTPPKTLGAAVDEIEALYQRILRR